MTPRWWDWLAMIATLCAGALWVGFGMPGLPNQYNPLLLPEQTDMPAAEQPAPAPLPVAAPPVSPPSLPEKSARLIDTPPVQPPVPPAARAESTPPPPARPPMPDVIGPIYGGLQGGQNRSPATLSQLPVVIHPSDRSQPVGMSGSGFFIARDGTFMTAAHVVRSCNSIFVVSRHLKQTDARLLAIDVDNDIAVLQADNIRPPGVLALADRPFGPEELDMLGYPGDGDRLRSSEARGQLLSDRPSFPGLAQLDRSDIFWMDANAIRPGFSGGPIVNPSGDAVGLINGMVVRHTAKDGMAVRDTKFVYGSSTHLIAEFLSHEVPRLVPNGDQSPPPDETDKAVVHVFCMR